MSAGEIVLVTLIVMILFTIIFTIRIIKELVYSEISFIGNKLENSDASIKEAITYLKITNKWDE